MMSDTADSDIELSDYNMDTPETSLLVNRNGTKTTQNNPVYKTLDDRSASDGNKPQTTPCFVWLLSFFAAVGGFLFGYDTGVVSGAMLLLTKRFNLTSLWEEIIVSATIAFACIFALVGAVLNDKLGRKITTLIASFVFTVGAVVLGVAQNIPMLVIGRSILGIGIGLASMTVPVYIAECAPTELRGRLVTLNNLFITGGQFVASVMDGAFSYVDDGWRFMFGLAGIPSFIQFIGFLFLPESPRWLIKKGREEQARSVLIKIRGTTDVDYELNNVRETCMEDEKKHQSEKSFVLIKVLRTPSVRRAVIVGCGLQMFQQLSGINTVMYYSATIIKMSGVNDQSEAIWLAAMTAGVNFVFTIVGVWLVEKIGRKKLALGSLIGVFISLIVLAVGFQLAAYNSPSVTVDEGNASCSSYSICENCIENELCGFCYNTEGSSSSAVNGSCLKTTDKDNGYSISGRCNTTHLTDNLIWAYDYCPTKYSLMGILGLVLYLMFFAPGMGPMPWTINSEIYPLWARSTGNALSSATNWLCNLIVSMTFLTLTETITKYGTYWLFVGIVFLAIIFIVVFLPETKGKSLEQVEQLFSKPWCKYPCFCGEDKIDLMPIQRSDS